MKPINTYIILKDTRLHSGQTIRTRYAVGAKDEKQAIEVLRSKIGKLCKLRVYYKEEVNFMKYKEAGEFNGKLINGRHVYDRL